MLKRITKYQIPSGPLPSYLFDVTQYKVPEKYTDTIEPAVITATLPEKFHGSQAAAARYAAGQKWGKENVAEPRDKFAQEYVLPAMGAAAFGIPGLVGAGGGFAVDATINALTNGNKNSFGDLFVDPEKHPILNTAVNFFNPGYYLGGLAVTKPLVQTVSPRTAIALGLEKEYLKNEIKALNRNIKNWKGNDVIKKNILAGKIGWAPKQFITLWHNSETPISKLETTFPSWDVTTHDAPLGHVWGTSTETRQGFIGARPYHNRTSKPIVLEKPMVQLNEAVGNGKNAVRNEILKFADQSGADAINFRNIKDNTLSNQDVYAVFKDVDVVPKLSEAERLGIPKGKRAKLSQDQLDALDDLLWWKQTGRHKTNFYFDETADKFRWGTPSSKKDSEIGAVKALIDHGGSARSETSPIRLSTKKGNFVIWPNRNAGYSVNFPVPDGMSWGPGEASISLVDDAGHEMKTVLTSPRVDYINSIEDDMSKPLLESLSNKIDKDIIRRFWSNNEEMIKPGTYLSGDNHASPLGTQALRTFDKTKSVESALSKILYPDKKIEGGMGLSPDSYSSIIRQAIRGNKKLRWGQGFTRWNPSAVENTNIYNSWKQMQSGIITPEKYKEIFDAWAIPLGGRPAEIKVSSPFRLVKNNDGTFSKVPQFQTKTVIMPHPYIMYRKQGGILKKLK